MPTPSSSADQQFLDDLDKKLWNAANRLRANYVMATPPYNISEWRDHRLEGAQRWVYGTPPKSNANFALVQHLLALPGELLTNTQIPPCVWSCTRNKNAEFRVNLPPRPEIWKN